MLLHFIFVIICLCIPENYVPQLSWPTFTPPLPRRTTYPHPPGHVAPPRVCIAFSPFPTKSAPISTDADAAAGGTGVTPGAKIPSLSVADNVGNGGHDHGGGFNVPTIEVPGPSAEEVMRTREYSNSVDSGSTTTEEAFPADNGVGGGGGSGDSGGGLDSYGSRNGLTVKTTSGSVGDGADGGYGAGKNASAIISGNGGGERRAIRRDRSSSGGEVESEEASGHGGREETGELEVEGETFLVSEHELLLHSSNNVSSSQRYASAGGEGRDPANTGSTDVDGGDDGEEDGGGVLEMDDELAQALADAAQARAEIDAAEAADIEAIRQRVGSEGGDTELGVGGTRGGGE